MTLRLRYSVRSHVGMVREGNEDSAYAGSRLALVADGMGGHAAGEVASSAVAATLAQLDEDEAGLDLLDVLAAAVRAANNHLRALVDADSALDGMGTTLTVMLSSGTRLGLAHVGDSRAYLLRDGAFSQITHDQTLVQRMVDEGRLTAEQAETHPQRSLLTQALDGRAGVEPDLSVREARRGDRYLLCSDGLSGYVPHGGIAASLQLPDADEAAERLIALALEAGAPDNVTVVIADVVDDSAGLQVTPVVGGAAAETAAVTSATPAVVPPGGASLAPGERGRREGIRRQQQLRETPPTGMPPITSEALGGRERRFGRGGALPWYRRRAPLALTGVVVVLVAGALITWVSTAHSWYVARSGNDAALYHGLQSKPLGISLSDVTERGTPFSQLLPVDQERVRSGIVADSRADGVCILSRLKFNAEQAVRQAAERANRERAQPSAGPAKPKAATTPKAAGTVKPTAIPKPTATPKPTASPTPSLPPDPTPLPKSCAT